MCLMVWNCSGERSFSWMTLCWGADCYDRWALVQHWSFFVLKVTCLTIYCFLYAYVFYMHTFFTCIFFTCIRFLHAYVFYMRIIHMCLYPANCYFVVVFAQTDFRCLSVNCVRFSYRALFISLYEHKGQRHICNLCLYTINTYTQLQW